MAKKKEDDLIIDKIVVLAKLSNGKIYQVGLNQEETKTVKTTNKNKVSFGFYNSLLLFIFIIIILSRGLYFFQDFVVQIFPITEFYIDYFFESIRNMFEIWKNLITNY